MDENSSMKSRLLEGIFFGYRHLWVGNLGTWTWQCWLENGAMSDSEIGKVKLANRKNQTWQCGFNNLAKVELAKVEKWTWWNTQAFGIPKRDTQHPYSWAFSYRKQMAKLMHKIQSPGSHWQWVMTSEREIYPLPIKFRFYDKGSRISFLCTVMLLTRLCISLNSRVRPWRQALTHVQQGDGAGPSNHVYQKSNAILTSCHWFKIQSSIHNWVIIIYMLPFKARSTLGVSTLIGIFKNIKIST